MDESGLRSVGADVESHLEVPDFATVAARGRRIHRRRTVAGVTGVAVVVALTVLGIARPFENNRTLQPVHQPELKVDRHGAHRVLADPGAQVDSVLSRVDGRGDMLAVIDAPAGSSGPDNSCANPVSQEALRWTAADGGSRSWVDRVKVVVPLEDGFVVGRTRCGAGAARSFLVDAAGRPRSITWTGRSATVCAPRPDDVRCRFDLVTGRATLVDNARLPAHTQLLGAGRGGSLWARSADSRRLFWSTDGRTWQSRATTLPAGSIVTASAAGRWGVLAGRTSAEVTSDGGRTWQYKDLTAALRPIVIGDVDWTVTSTGVLMGVTQLVGKGDVMFRSTDSSWAHFVPTGVHTAFGLIRPTVQGDAVYVVDEERWAVSTDDGATWTRTPALR